MKKVVVKGLIKESVKCFMEVMIVYHVIMLILMAIVSGCSLTTKYDLRRQRYCEKDEIGYICPGSHEQFRRDPFERFRKPSAVVNCVTSMEHVGSHLETVEICE